MRVHTITFHDPNGPAHPLTSLSSEMLHKLIETKHLLEVTDPEHGATVDNFVEQAQIILDLRDMGAPI
jgi:hypothetical protein